MFATLLKDRTMIARTAVVALNFGALTRAKLDGFAVDACRAQSLELDPFPDLVLHCRNRNAKGVCMPAVQMIVACAAPKRLSAYAYCCQPINNQYAE